MAADAAGGRDHVGQTEEAALAVWQVRPDMTASESRAPVMWCGGVMAEAIRESREGADLGLPSCGTEGPRDHGIN